MNDPRDVAALFGAPGPDRTPSRRLRARVVALVLGIALALGSGGLPLTPNAAVAADAPSEIPGIPFVGPIQSGFLGGPIYDVVYSVTAPAGSVIVIGLTGSPEADFDLYLFASTATTVLPPYQGLLASSTGPTVNENLSWPTQSGGTFYIDLNGVSEIQGAYVLSVQVVPDQTPPTLSLTAKNGAATVNTSRIGLVLDGRDDLSGVAESSFSSDGIAWSDWEPYAIAKSWPLDPPDGPRTVWARVRNGVGLISSPVSLVVTLDTTRPEVVARSPLPDATVPQLRPTIRVTFNEPIVPGSWTRMGLILQSTNGAIIPGSSAYDAATKSGTFIPSADLVAGALYLVTIGAVTDLADNLVASPGLWSFRPLVGAAVSLSASPTTILRGGGTTLSGRVAAPGGRSATLEVRRADSTTFTPVVGVAPLSGSFSVRVAPVATSWYRVNFAGTSTIAAAISVEVRVAVRRGITIAGTAPSVLRTATAGRTLSVAAQLGPRSGGGTVTFTSYRWDAARARWVKGKSYVRTANSLGRAVFRWTPTAGRWAWKASVGGTTLFANNSTALYRWLVTR